jgi:ADP-heptose:LPS heptosyltransferase
MTSSFYREKWSNMKLQTVDPQEFGRLSRQIAYAFMDAYLKDCHYESDYIELLCEMATCSTNPNLNGIAVQALFRIIIESLCDDFEDLQTETYNRVMTQVITFCRRLPAGEDLDLRLSAFGIHRRRDLLERIQTIRARRQTLTRQRDIRKILLLSRVTIGADVAITSVVIQRLARLFPQAQIVMIGGNKLTEIYGGNATITFRNVDYSKNGGLIERLAGWQVVLETVQEELTTCPLPNTILIDPDSRLSQLGVLPVIQPDHYFFFDSRSEVSFDSKMSMAELTNAWLNQLTGEVDFCYPCLWQLPANLQKAARLSQQLKKGGAKRVIVINFGVGGNPRKKVGQLFEAALLESLLKEPHTVILLDKGSGDSELRYSNALLQAVRAQGYPVRDVEFDGDFEMDSRNGIVGLQTRIGELAAIIAQCDEYIGYDSACQHIAAALQTPCLTIFAGSNNMRFIRRWSAFGPNSCRIVHVDTLTDPTAIDIEDIITRIMNERRTRVTN